MSDLPEDRKLLQFSVGPVLCCADSVSIHRIIEPPDHLVYLPGHAQQPAIFRHEGRMASVIDMRNLFGLTADPENKNAEKLIIVETPEGLFAYWVDAVSSIVSDSEGKWGLLPAVVPRNLFDAAFNLQGKLILHVDFSHIVHAEATPWVYESGLYPRNISESPEPRVQETITEIREPGSQPETVPENKTPELNQQKVERPATDLKRARTEPVMRESLIKASAQPVQKPAAQERHSSFASKTSVEKPVERSSSSRDYSQTMVNEPAVEHEVSDQTQSSISSTQSDEQGAGWLLPVFVMLILLLGVGYLITSYMKEEKVSPGLVRVPDIEMSQEESVPMPEPPAENMPEPELKPPMVSGAEIVETPVSEEAGPSSSIEREGDTVTITVYEGVAPEIIAAVEQPPAGVQSDQEMIVLSDKQSETLSHEKGISRAALDPDTLELNWSHHRQAQVDVEAMHEQGNQHEKAGQVVPVPVKPVLVIEEIVHVVVKGDTLWDIAGKYIHDPFRYPELARLSKISNPDLIYPGDKVRIRIIRHKSGYSVQ